MQPAVGTHGGLDSLGHALTTIERGVIDAVKFEWDTRDDSATLALVGVPLVMNASGLVALWWTWVPLLLCCWMATREWQWSWVLALQLGAIGTEWAYVGAVSLARWPAHRILIGCVWAGFALVLAVSAHINRRRLATRRGEIRY